ncbi:hypothetical protein APUTEX25_005377 [Auxenochlorella protothecoides]|uniref:Major facilitator superfamily (MFS) profile domain-containing protein n=1 Tax=Auxenochlorella protothecoides TaxID=3075 RepID=A0A3M7KUK8_AUXPR|nr:hypothetical protein APUTEX25_005377 [Auxenochlorella protothecoides]|eukprot:RMZ54221.1 hypothetical protein APUTEX25_005377 [Auxenochlorella protothecoides]
MAAAAAGGRPPAGARLRPTASVRRGAQAAGHAWAPRPASWAAGVRAAAPAPPPLDSRWAPPRGRWPPRGAGPTHLDVAPKHAGLVWGAGSSAATAAGLLAVPVSGVVLEATGSWAAVFGLAAAIYALGAGLYWVWAGGEALLADG